MKIKLITILFLLSSSKLFSQNSDYTDTLWLHNKFILNKTNYENKKLKVLLDTLLKYKITITVVFCICQSVNAAPPIDTMVVLNAKVQQKKNLFINKPLRILLDTLKKNKLTVVEYSGPHEKHTPIYKKDTLKIESIEVYFEEYLGTEKLKNRLDAIAVNKGRDTLNTHIPRITIYFKTPLLFLRKWIDEDRQGIASNTWNIRVANFYRSGIIKDLKVDEF
jgi:hypothetical protein